MLWTFSGHISGKRWSALAERSRSPFGERSSWYLGGFHSHGDTLGEILFVGVMDGFNNGWIVLGGFQNGWVFKSYNWGCFPGKHHFMTSLVKKVPWSLLFLSFVGGVAIEGSKKSRSTLEAPGRLLGRGADAGTRWFSSCYPGRKDETLWKFNGLLLKIAHLVRWFPY